MGSAAEKALLWIKPNYFTISGIFCVSIIVLNQKNTICEYVKISD